MGGTTKQRKWKDTALWAKIRQFPSQLRGFIEQHMKEKTSLFQPVPVSKDTVQRLDSEWTKQLELTQGGVVSSQAAEEESQLLQQIRTITEQKNRNNVTRTEAYWHIYAENPELHWALLAHMVSRNGGWCMTDLQGDMLPRLLPAKLADSLFAFLERANSLIFHDAYPQLLLYQESKKKNKPLFHLLTALGVSSWMLPVWEEFWRSHDAAVLTISLIVNEQNFIEHRIVQNELYQKTVLDQLLFKSQAFLQLNQVAFPFKLRSANEPGNPWHFAGLILEHFAHLSERIEFGKSLYAIIYGVPEVLQGVVRFASSTPHTGSRADYWPKHYSPIAKTSPDTKYQRRLDGSAWKANAVPLYSPPLAQAWPDRLVAPVEPGDWFTDVSKPLSHMTAIPVPVPFDMTNEIFDGLNKLELAICAKELL
ncbi:DUF2515 domain-containing protein [Paenibacillus sp. HWE-109]|uniref:DUF2515 family protein n=1 Tax=Paenibacillus sp. HWE-109 TaxID=1306526 RepID=UPI001EE12819|nr:DUF2515 family protein [Paenibacillus sp. HWE-109]UKS27496.1 DUF2515 domain-containing protein [Paenibacillus sp. HWE-109]